MNSKKIFFKEKNLTANKMITSNPAKNLTLKQLWFYHPHA